MSSRIESARYPSTGRDGGGHREVAGLLAKPTRIPATFPFNRAREALRLAIEHRSDCFWELDRELRISAIWCRDPEERAATTASCLGKALWETGGVPVNCSWNDHIATLRACEPFDNLLLEHPEAGKRRYLTLAGKPRLNRRGEFLGYIGVTRDVTEAMLKERAARFEVFITRLLAEKGIALAMRELLDTTCRFFGWSCGRFWLRSGADSHMRLEESTLSEERVTSPPDCRGAPLIHKGEGSIGGLWKTEEADWISCGGATLAVQRTSNCSSMAVLPLVTSSTVVGLLEFRAPGLSADTPYLRVLLRLSGQICSALERQRAIVRLRESEERFASTVELAAIGICHVGKAGRIIHVNRQMTEILGYTREELLSKSVKDLSHPEDRNATEEYLGRLAAKEIDSFRIEKRYVRKDGEAVWVRINTVMKWDADGNPLHHISVVEDISDRKAAEARIAHLATHDDLTGLPNKALFNEILSRTVLTHARRNDCTFALLFIDLDRFKAINDSLGHQAGDSILRMAADKIGRCVRKSDCVARFGGDEFVVLLDCLEEAADGESIARKISGALQETANVRGHECRMTASIGVALWPEDGADAEALMRNADVAMYAAKQDGRNRVQRYTVDLPSMSVQQVTLESHLLRGLERKEFRLQYQPIIDARSRDLVGAEALLRWWNAELGTISPAQFVPVAEETGLILPIGRWALRKACRQAADWRRRNGSGICVCVNLSPRQIGDPGLVEFIRSTLEDSGLTPERLELEITESGLMADVERFIEVSRAVRDLGVRLAVDDFGTGYSSLAQLKRVPLDTLKIDRSFVRDIVSSDEDRAITAAIIDLGKKLGATVVAEGVEDEGQCALLAEMGCDRLQGYYFGEPCHPDRILQPR